MPQPADISYVFLAALVTALATGLGALPLLWVKRVEPRWIGIGSGIASGLMLAASVMLFVEGNGHHTGRTVLGALIGIIAIWLSARLVPNNEHDGPDADRIKRLNVRAAVMLLAVMTAHSFAEGIGVGVAFGDGEEFGAFITLAIAIHNIPEGLAISLVLVPQGVSVLRAGLWSVFSSLPQPLMAIPAFIFVSEFRWILPAGLGLAGGAMVWMVFAQLLPEARRECSTTALATATSTAFIAMMALQAVLST